MACTTRPDAEVAAGGSGDIAIANAGGGLVHIAAADLILSGDIRANGGNGQDNGWNNASGAGSGGAILLDLGTLTGAGFIAANGGNGAGPAGAGGGGRVAIHCAGTNTLVPGHVTAAGGTGGPGDGSDGSVNTDPLTSETTAPFLLSVDPSGCVTSPIDVVTLVFSEGLSPATFTVADVTLLSPAGTALPSAGLSLVTLAADRFELRLSTALADEGTYTLSVGPDILDLHGP